MKSLQREATIPTTTSFMDSYSSKHSGLQYTYATHIIMQYLLCLCITLEYCTETDELIIRQSTVNCIQEIKISHNKHQTDIHRSPSSRALTSYY